MLTCESTRSLSLLFHDYSFVLCCWAGHRHTLLRNEGWSRQAFGILTKRWVIWWLVMRKRYLPIDASGLTIEVSDTVDEHTLWITSLHCEVAQFFETRSFKFMIERLLGWSGRILQSMPRTYARQVCTARKQRAPYAAEWSL